jgi:hypothetical protein
MALGEVFRGLKSCGVSGGSQLFHGGDAGCRRLVQQESVGRKCAFWQSCGQMSLAMQNECHLPDKCEIASAERTTRGGGVAFVFVEMPGSESLLNRRGMLGAIHPNVAIYPCCPGGSRTI